MKLRSIFSKVSPGYLSAAGMGLTGAALVCAGTMELNRIMGAAFQAESAVPAKMQIAMGGICLFLAAGSALWTAISDRKKAAAQDGVKYIDLPPKMREAMNKTERKQDEQKPKIK